MQWHESMGEHARQHWEKKRGIPGAFQDWWQLGFVYDHRFYANAAAFQADAETIPIFGLGRTPLNVKLRLQQFAEEHGKYRYLLAPRLLDEHPPFLCNPDSPLGDDLIVVEGEIKAMVTFATLDDSKISMIGIPSCRVNPQTVAMLRERDRVTFVADPDARKPVWDLCKEVGTEKCRVVVSPMKIDDGIIAAGMTKRDVQHLLSTASPAKVV